MQKPEVVHKPKKNKTDMPPPDMEKVMDAPAKAVFVGPSPDGAMKRNPSISMAQQLAESATIFFNYKWPDAEKDFPAEPWLRTVRQCFPHAKGGPILVDYEKLPGEAVKFERKAKALRARGHCYIVVKDKMTLQEVAECLNGARQQLSLSEDSSTVPTPS